MESTKGNFFITTDKTQLDVTAIHNFLSTESYWAKDIPLEKVQKSISNSLCFGVFHKNEQIGFARIISDFSSFAYLADVYIKKEFRGKGLSTWLMEIIIHHKDLQGLRRWMLGTKDAHKLYEKFGFISLKEPQRFMELHNSEVYNKKS